MRTRLFTFVLASLLVGGLAAFGQRDAVQSGLPAGADIPSPFHAYIVNGKYKGRYHCLVCERGLDPTVALFVRGVPTSEPFVKLLSQLDAATQQFAGARFGAMGVFTADDLKDEAERDALAVKIEDVERQAKLKNVTLAIESVKNLQDPNDPKKGYQLNPQAELTVLLYKQQHVAANFAFAAGKFTDADVAKVMKAVAEMVTKK
jgi:hypothetical protein